MNVFILNTGRCGSVTFIRACQHISNYTAGHETRSNRIGDAHFNYPDNHIEADNRLAWFLGRLDRAYGDNAIYVHLRRDPDATARSYVKRYGGGIIRTYRKSILMGRPDISDPMTVSQDFLDTVTSNIELFLRDKSQVIDFSLENTHQDFRKFFNVIKAKGDLNAALSEWDSSYNAYGQWKLPIKLQRIARQLRGILPTEKERNH
ncbi:MAG: hypothetical protein ABFS22_09630 [Pseudomonadota bacterium]